MTNAVVTLAVVMVALAVHDRFVAPRVKGGNEEPAPTPRLAEEDED